MGLVSGISPRQLINEFKAFALKGNMIDLAVAVVIGKAFGDVINSIVKNVITPLIGYVTPNLDFSAWHIGRVMIGNLLNDVITFLIIAAAVFFAVVKVMGFLINMRKKKEEAPAEAPPPPEDIKLLTEIRDLLKANAGKVG
jgi:large conductance mechanosensitive channel